MSHRKIYEIFLLRKINRMYTHVICAPDGVRSRDLCLDLDLCLSFLSSSTYMTGLMTGIPSGDCSIRYSDDRGWLRDLL